MNELRFNWIGEAISFGQKVKYFSISAHGLELVFCVYKKAHEDSVFEIERQSKNTKVVNKTRVIDEDVKEVHMIKTDTDFRRKFKHSYYIMKFVTEDNVISIGAYSDSKDLMTPDNSYILCTADFINLLAKSEKVETGAMLKETNFQPLLCLFDKNEMTKELLRD